MTLTAQQPDNNVVRVALQALAAVLGRLPEPAHERQGRGARPAHRGLGPPRPAHAAGHRPRVGRRRHRGPAGRVLRGGGGHDARWRAEALRLLDAIEARGGALRAIERGEIQREIQESAYRFQRQVEAGERVIVGVNRFQEEGEEPPADILRIDPALERAQVERAARAARAPRSRPPGRPPSTPSSERARGRREPDARRSSTRCWPGPRSGRSRAACATSSASTGKRWCCERDRGIDAGAAPLPPARRGGDRARVPPAHHLPDRRRQPLRARGGRAGRAASGRPGAAGGGGGRARRCSRSPCRLRPALARRCRGCARCVPFLACILIYTNLHDTIGFVNPHDVHHWLVALDRVIFGVQPVRVGGALHHPRPHRGDAVPLPELLLDRALDRAPPARCSAAGRSSGPPPWACSSASTWATRST